jgi:hypothetical protein
LIGAAGTPPAFSTPSPFDHIPFRRRRSSIGFLSIALARLPSPRLLSSPLRPDYVMSKLSLSELTFMWCFT